MGCGLRCCIGGGGRNQIKPLPGYYDDHDFIEARPGRFMRVTHHNFGSRVGNVETKLTAPRFGDPAAAAAPDDPTAVGAWVSRRVGYEAPSVRRGGVSLNPQDWIVFLVHGVGGSAAVWNHQMTYLAQQGYRVVAPDLIGHGGSSRPGQASSYSFKQHAADVLAVFDHYSDAKGNVLVGHSFGCSICTYVAFKRAYAVCKMALIAGGGPDALTPTPLCNVLSLPNCVFHLFRPCCYAYARSRMYNNNRKQLSGHHNNSHELLFDQVSPEVIKYTLQHQVWLEGDEDLHGNLRIDTQLVVGGDDSLVDKEDMLRMHDTLRYSRLDLIVDASHMVMLENHDLVNSLINEFLNQQIPTQTDFVDFHISGFFGEDSSQSTIPPSPTKTVQYHQSAFVPR